MVSMCCGVGIIERGLASFESLILGHLMIATSATPLRNPFISLFGYFLLLRKLLLVSFCIVVWIFWLLSFKSFILSHLVIIQHPFHP